MARFETIGERIAVHRKRRGLSQAQLAGLVGRTSDYISKIERGDRPVDRLSLLTPIAEVLRVPISELTGEAPALASDPQEQLKVVRGIRMALTGHQFLRVLLDPTSQATAPRDLTGLRSQVDLAWGAGPRLQLPRGGALLRPLIPEAETTARECPTAQRNEAFALLSDVYQIAAARMAQLGETDVAWVAADRAEFAAERAEQPLLAAAGDFRLGHAFLGGGRSEQAERAARLAADALENVPDRDLKSISLHGALQLGQRQTTIEQPLLDHD
jgi:transcriptional regulator with XRE-family HTH domain